MTVIVVFGSINYDLVTTAKRIPSHGETIAASGFKTFHGGKGANQARALRRLSKEQNVQVKMIGRVGQDVFGKELLDGLKDEGIDTSLVEQLDNVPTGVATIIVDEQIGENRILVYPGANGTFDVNEGSENIWNEIRKADYLVLQNEIPISVVFKAIEIAHDANVSVVYNPSPMVEIPKQILSKVSLLVLNSTEADSILSSTSENPLPKIDDNRDIAERAMSELQSKYPSSNILITLGANGCVFATPSQRGTFSAAKAEKVVDTTGAGDTFLGAFISIWSENRTDWDNISSAIDFASRASALAVARPGAAAGIPYLHELS